MKMRENPRFLPDAIRHTWNAASSVYGGMLIGAAVLATAVTLQTGQNFTLFVQSGLDDRDLTSIVNLAFCISFSLFIATFLIGYSLNGNKWALGSWCLMVYLITFPSSFPLFVLAYVPLLGGLIASHYFNRYCQHARIAARRHDRLSFVFCRYAILAICASSLLLFITPSSTPFALILILWGIQSSLMLSGAIRTLWGQATLASIAG